MRHGDAERCSATGEEVVIQPKTTKIFKGHTISHMLEFNYFMFFFVIYDIYELLYSEKTNMNYFMNFVPKFTSKVSEKNSP